LTARLGTRLVARGLIASWVIAGTLFGVSGRLDWAGAWILVLVASTYFAAASAYFSQTDPALLVERMSRPANVPAWDRLIVAIYPLLFVWLLATAALDARRGRIAGFPLAVQAAGAIGMVAGLAVVWWSTATNHFLASFARLQPDRGQRVVDTGPYAIVRHPMYAASIVIFVCAALLLQSWRALAPASAIAALLTVRTRLEDQMLHDGLAGYRAYAARVRHRLLPGVW
jgi:protein-S-isoprenylcysteine O-methyltransferase Ste14